MQKQFGFLLFDQFEDLDFFGPWEMFGLWHKNFNGPKLVTISETGAPVSSTKNLTITPDYTIENCPALDYLLVPGGQGTRTEVNNKNLISFIAKQATHCEQVLSVCTGAFMLHQAGLLNDKQATTHWASLDRLRALSKVSVLEQRFVNDGNIWTSAGIAAGMDMALAFIAAISDEKTAGNIQLQTEYYPQQKIYPHDNVKLPAYVTKQK